MASSDYFEMKASGRGLPAQVSLTPNEVERAQREGDKFFLAIVGGLEAGAVTTIRIFANPLKTLDWRVPHGLILVALHDKRGLTIQIEAADSAVPVDTSDLSTR
ncbi:hypothetical protein AYO38_05940 [bacterium SCGC AG-212-C10]|nr:hypothetical protein AYO38_05940 [bacterium SCGC AG-212-C10]